MSCDSAGGPGDGTPETRHFEFLHTTSSKTFVAGTTDPEVIEEVEAQLDKPLEERNRHIDGAIARGDRAKTRSTPGTS